MCVWGGGGEQRRSRPHFYQTDVLTVSSPDHQRTLGLHHSLAWTPRRWAVRSRRIKSPCLWDKPITGSSAWVSSSWSGMGTWREGALLAPLYATAQLAPGLTIALLSPQSPLVTQTRVGLVQSGYCRHRCNQHL